MNTDNQTLLDLADKLEKVLATTTKVVNLESIFNYSDQQVNDLRTEFFGVMNDATDHITNNELKLCPDVAAKAIGSYIIKNPSTAKFIPFYLTTIATLVDKCAMRVAAKKILAKCCTAPKDGFFPN